MKITDKMRLDFLQRESTSTNCPKGWQGAVFQTGFDCEFVFLRDAIDFAIKSKGVGK